VTTPYNLHGHVLSNRVAIIVLGPLAPDLRLVKAGSGVGTVTVRNGSPLTFFLRAVNNASAGPTLGDITVTDTLPIGLSFVSAGSDARCSVAGQVVTCTDPGPLNPGQSLTFTVHTQVGPAMAAVGQRMTLSNTAGVTTPYNLHGHVLSNRVAIIVLGPLAPDVSVMKQASPGPLPTRAETVNGGQVKFLLSATNATTAGPTVGDITVTDRLPAGLIFDGSLSDTRCRAARRVVTCVDHGPLAAGQGLSFKVITRVGSAVAGAGRTVTLPNTATVTTPYNLHGAVRSSPVTIVVRGQ
jgi:uncharacterized repeat protein (TIGR01451 family)